MKKTLPINHLHIIIAASLFLFSLSLTWSFYLLSLYYHHCVSSRLAANATQYSSIEGLPVYSIYIASHSLEELSLTSLQKVKNGRILIERNPALCYVQEPMWEPLIRYPESQMILVENNKPAGDCSKYERRHGNTR